MAPEPPYVLSLGRSRDPAELLEITFGTLPDGAFFAALHNRREPGATTSRSRSCGGR